MTPNTLLRKLRIERGITQKELADGISARNTLGSYELGGTAINYHLLRQYLEKLNVSMEEFDFLLTSNSEVHKKNFAAMLESLYYHHDFERLKSLLKKIEIEYTKTGDFYYFHLFAQYRMAMSKLNIYPLSQIEMNTYAEKIQKYLSQIETWGKFEAALFINFMYIFETDYLLFSLKYIIKKQEFYGPLYKKYQLLEKMHLNALYLLAERGETQALSLIIKSLKKIIDVDDLKYKVILSFFEAYIINDIENMQIVLQTLRYFDMHDYADYLEKLSNVTF